MYPVNPGSVKDDDDNNHAINNSEEKEEEERGLAEVVMVVEGGRREETDGGEERGRRRQGVVGVGEGEESQSVVRSSAVVQSSLVPGIPQFLELGADTDLRLAPDNWLHGVVRAGQHSLPTWFLMPRPRTAGLELSSGTLAAAWAHLLDSVDVVADAEHIKTILKLPLAPDAVSLLVHRVGRTLLVDEVRGGVDYWPPSRGTSAAKRHTRQALASKNLLSKFLFRSLASDKDPIVLSSSNHHHHHQRQEQEKNSSSSSYADHPVFSRTLLWTFEDIRMLIGSNMPIYGGGTHPVVSLRLHDVRRPITVLTGLDYWLDNLMCNVPELVMCYHLDGIVRKYECFRTDDLPRANGFSPLVVKDVARNILSFLKSNATLPGHTYWLFKGKNDDVVKLYDLTSLCRQDREEQEQQQKQQQQKKKKKRCEKQQQQHKEEQQQIEEDNNVIIQKQEEKNTIRLGNEKGKEEEEESDDGGSVENPYTVPVALLLYRVAKNLLTHETMKGRRAVSTIGSLLTNCVALLDETEHSGVVSGSHFMLANLCLEDLRCLRVLEDEEEDNDNQQQNKKEEEKEKEVVDVVRKCCRVPVRLGENAGAVSSMTMPTCISTKTLLLSSQTPPPTTQPSLTEDNDNNNAEGEDVEGECVPASLQFRLPAAPVQRASLCLQHAVKALRVLSLVRTRHYCGPSSTAIPLLWTPVGESESIVQVFHAPTTASSSSCGTSSNNKKGDDLSNRAELALLLWRKAATACLVAADHCLCCRSGASRAQMARYFASAALFCRREAGFLARRWQKDACLERDLDTIESLALSLTGHANFVLAVGRTEGNDDDDDEEEEGGGGGIRKNQEYLDDSSSSLSVSEVRRAVADLCALSSGTWSLPSLATTDSDSIDLLRASLAAFELAARGPQLNGKAKTRLFRRLGGAANELGARLLNCASTLHMRRNDDDVDNNDNVVVALATATTTTRTAPVSTSSSSSVTCHSEWLSEAERVLHRAMRVFQAVSDVINVAVVCANLGRLSRTRAHLAVGSGGGGTGRAISTSWAKVAAKQKQFLRDAVEWYKRSLMAVESEEGGLSEMKATAMKKKKQQQKTKKREEETVAMRMRSSAGRRELARRFRWDLSTTYLNLGSVMQDWNQAESLDNKEALADREQQVAQALEASMDCVRALLLPGRDSAAADGGVGGGDDDDDDEGKEEDDDEAVFYQYRVAMLHRRLGSLWHHGVRQRNGAIRGNCQCSEEKDDESLKHQRRRLCVLAERHLSAAAAVFLAIDRPVDALKDLVALTALTEQFEVEGEEECRGSLSLDRLLECRDALEKALSSLSLSSSLYSNGDESEEVKDMRTILRVLVQRLRAGLLALAKRMNKRPKEEKEEMVEAERLAVVKQCYAEALRLPLPACSAEEDDDEEKENLKETGARLVDALKSVADALSTRVGKKEGRKEGMRKQRASC